MIDVLISRVLKVMLLLIFFLVAFAAAFTVIMNDRSGFQNFGLSMLTSATMTMGEFDFKETFLTDTYAEYNTFYWLRLFHLILFLVVMPIIIMNLLLALAIDDTSSIMQQAKLQKHIQTVCTKYGQREPIGSRLIVSVQVGVGTHIPNQLSTIHASKSWVAKVLVHQLRDTRGETLLYTYMILKYINSLSV